MCIRDRLFTLPAYVVIFSLLWFFINRYRYTLWNYILVMGLAQTLGDGGLFFFIDAPAMLFFLPYPMTNYHAINIIPFLAVRDHLPPARSISAGRYLAIPALIGAYLVCGAITVSYTHLDVYKRQILPGCLFEVALALAPEREEFLDVQAGLAQRVLRRRQRAVGVGDDLIAIAVVDQAEQQELVAAAGRAHGLQVQATTYRWRWLHPDLPLSLIHI